jgi:quercetin dioxygenase-like cupin family protein
MKAKLFVPALFAALAVGTTALVAGECPADQVRAGAVSADGHTANIGVTDTVLGVNKLGEHYPDLASRDQRIRLLTIEPGGEVAWHDHSDRPALIYVVSGQIVEHRSSCAMPIVHVAGTTAMEIGDFSHWWKNESQEPVTLISTDLPRNEAADDDMM